MAKLCRCKHCNGYLEKEPVQPTTLNPHAANVCPYCGKELRVKEVDYSCQTVDDAVYEKTSKMSPRSNYFH